MSKSRSESDTNRPPSKEETEAVSENILALRRIVKIARQAGAHDQDIAKAGAWPLLWCWEVIKRNDLERHADIGRRVSNSRSKEDTAERDQRYAEILLAACRLLVDGAKPRGLAGKIKRELNSDLSTRQINRILDKWVPILLSK